MGFWERKLGEKFSWKRNCLQQIQLRSSIGVCISTLRFLLDGWPAINKTIEKAMVVQRIYRCRHNFVIFYIQRLW